MRKIFFLSQLLLSCFSVFAQTYTPQVSKDSLGVLTARVKILKMNIDLLEMKIKESEEEEEVEKLRLKLMEANGKMKVSAEKTSAHGSKTGKGAEVDLKAMEKLSKQAKNDSEDAIKALDRFNKQIAKVEKLRLEIQAEERKIGYVKPWVAFNK
ncbi:hypothetical protein [Pedobacter sp.]|uniref:hypothetical protein n=1 Tax=Pedobacter sp. TaxID=1411316 RepID=UPI003BAC4B22